MGLLLIGAVLVSVTDTTHFKGFFQKGVLMIIGMQFLHAGANIGIGFALQHTTIWQVMIYSFGLSSAWVSMYVLLKRAKVTHDFAKIKWMLLRGILLLLATGYLYKAYETNVSISSALGLLSSPLVLFASIFFAYLFPNFLEKQSAKTYAFRIVGMAVILLGAWNLGMMRN